MNNERLWFLVIGMCHGIFICRVFLDLLGAYSNRTFSLVSALLLVAGAIIQVVLTRRTSSPSEDGGH